MGGEGIGGVAMRSGWWWKTEEWNRYLREYAKTRPECLHEWKSSPLDPEGHDFTQRKMNTTYAEEEHLSQVIDLRTHKWSDVRKSYHSIIHRGQEKFITTQDSKINIFYQTHRLSFGDVRTKKTFEIQDEWIKSGNALVLSTMNSKDEFVSSVLWIMYQGCAYYASSPSLEKNVQHSVIWQSLQLLKKQGITLVELGQIDGETEKEKNIGKFKQGFGGEPKPFTIVRRAI